jgi:hypothetical protein
MTSTSIPTIARRYFDTESAAVYLGMSADGLYSDVAGRHRPGPGARRLRECCVCIGF